MVKIFVIYPGGSSTRFDRDYYRSHHLPMVMDAWREHGLQSLAVFYPESDGAGTIAICACVFTGEAAVQAALHSPGTQAIMDDIPHFTDSKPTQSRIAPL